MKQVLPTHIMLLHLLNCLLIKVSILDLEYIKDNPNDLLSQIKIMPFAMWFMYIE